MSREIVAALMEPVETSFTLLEKFIDDCPDELWPAIKGGWPQWQQIYHAVETVDFFIIAPDAAGPEPLAPPPVGALAEVASDAVSKADIRAALIAARARVDKFVEGLTDADLPKRNEDLFAKFEMEMSLAGSIAMIAAHNLYHLGSCDAALRDQGLPGVF